MAKNEIVKGKMLPYIVNNDQKRGVISIAVPDQQVAEELAVAAESLGISGDISPKDCVDLSENIGPGKVHSMSTTGDNYERIFGHTNFIGDKSNKQ